MTGTGKKACIQELLFDDTEEEALLLLLDMDDEEDAVESSEDQTQSQKLEGWRHGKATGNWTEHAKKKKKQ